MASPVLCKSKDRYIYRMAHWRVISFVGQRGHAPPREAGLETDGKQYVRSTYVHTYSSGL